MHIHPFLPPGTEEWLAVNDRLARAAASTARLAPA